SALDLARNYKVPRQAADALGNLADLYNTQDRLEEAYKAASDARDFYQQGGYLREAVSSALLMARVRGRQGDYDGALRAIEDQLRVEAPTGDLQMIGQLHRECGSVLAKQGRFAEAVEHYRESISIAKTLHDDVLLSYSLLNLANS